jgi:hypothetical protein
LENLGPQFLDDLACTEVKVAKRPLGLQVFCDILKGLKILKQKMTNIATKIGSVMN